MKRWLFLIYGVGCHLLFLATFAYMACFVGNLFIPKTIDTPAPITLPTALGINFMLLSLFAVQHSVMARPGFKQEWTRIVPQPVERSTYVLFSCVVSILMMVLWQGIDIVVWDVQNSAFRKMLWGLFACGWLLVPVVSLLINHFDLFGTRQVWLYFRGEQYKPLEFRVPLFYKHVRHPLYIGWALAFWATPTMTVGHMFFAGMLTIYMVGAAVIEERDLIAHFGEQYQAYRRRVPMFVPRFGKLAPEESSSQILKADVR